MGLTENRGTSCWSAKSNLDYAAIASARHRLILDREWARPGGERDQQVAAVLRHCRDLVSGAAEQIQRVRRVNELAVPACRDDCLVGGPYVDRLTARGRETEGDRGDEATDDATSAVVSPTSGKGQMAFAIVQIA